MTADQFAEDLARLVGEALRMRVGQLEESWPRSRASLIWKWSWLSAGVMAGPGRV